MERTPKVLKNYANSKAAFKRIILLFGIFGSTAFAQYTLWGAGNSLPGPLEIAPGEVTTLFATGLSVRIGQPVYASAVPLPAALAGVSVNIRQSSTQTVYPVPLFSVQQTDSCANDDGTTPGCVLTAITVQIPFELTPTPLNASDSGLTLDISESGVRGKGFPLRVLSDKIHVLTTCDTVFGPSAATAPACVPVITHADGSFVSANSPAIPGETIVIYALGLGKTSPAVRTGQASPSSPAKTGVIAQHQFYPNAGPSRPRRHLTR